MQNVFFTNTAEKHSTAICEQNLSKLTCFTEAAEAIAMLSRFQDQFRTVNSDLIFAWFAEIQISKCRIRIPRPVLFFTSSRFRDSSLRHRDFETRRKFAETHYFSRTILYPLICSSTMLGFTTSWKQEIYMVESQQQCRLLMTKRCALTMHLFCQITF